MSESTNEEAERRKHRKYLINLQRALAHREAILRILDTSEDAEQATSEIMPLLGVDETTAIGILNLHLRDFSRDRRRALDERIRQTPENIQDNAGTTEGQE